MINENPLFTPEALAGIAAVLCDEQHKLSLDDFLMLFKQAKITSIDPNSVMQLKVYNTLFYFQKSKGFSNNIYYFIGEAYRKIRQKNDDISTVLVYTALNKYLITVGYEINSNGSFTKTTSSLTSKQHSHNQTNSDLKDVGYVYIISNDAMPNLYKVGYTTRKSQDRANGLNIEAGTGMPGKYKVLYEKETISPYQVEQYAHRLLKDKKFGKEWFKCSNINICVNAINEAYHNVGGARKELEALRRAEEEKKAIMEAEKRQIERESQEFERVKAKYNTALDKYNKIYDEECEQAHIKCKDYTYRYCMIILYGSMLFCFLMLKVAPNEIGNATGVIMVVGLLVGLFGILYDTHSTKYQDDFKEYLANSKRIKQGKAERDKTYSDFRYKYADINKIHQPITMNYHTYKSQYK